LTWLIALAALNLYLLNTSHMVFMDPDEGRCVMIAHKMLDSGNWLVLQQPLAAAPYFDKPILYFWMLAGTLRLLGTSEFSARLLTVVGAALAVGATYQLGCILRSKRTGLLASAMLGTCVMMQIAGRFVRMDMWLTAFVAWGIVFWARAHFENASRHNLLLGYTCLAAALLTKGLIGVLLPFAAIGAFLAWRRDWSSIGRSGLWWGVLLIVLLAGPWYAYMAFHYPGYLGEFFWKQHVLRAATGTFGRGQMPLFLPAVAMAGLLPWTAFLCGGLARAFPIESNRNWPRTEAMALPRWWAALGILPFALSRTQLPVYVAPAFPALALIAADYLDRLLEPERERELKWMTIATLALMGACLFTLALINQYTFCSGPWQAFARRAVGFVPVSAIVIALLRRNRSAGAVGALVAGTIALAVDASHIEGPAMFAHFSSQRFAQCIANNADAGTELLVGPSPRYAMTLYCEKPVEVKHLAHLVDFLEYTDHPHSFVGLLTSERLYGLARSQLPGRMQLLDHRGDEYLVRITAKTPATYPAAAFPVARRQDRMDAPVVIDPTSGLRALDR
jgi:4-amino-4-deoxy-L-arabinose transferase-like glycosyltransferase